MAAVAASGSETRHFPLAASEQRPEISAIALQALVEAEKDRLAPEFEELYKQRVAGIEEEARAAAQENLQRAENEAQEEERRMDLAASSPGDFAPSSPTTAAERSALAAEATQPPDAASLIAAAALERREVAALEGEILQERVFCEELEASEQANEARYQQALEIDPSLDPRWRLQRSELEAHAASELSMLEARAASLRVELQQWRSEEHTEQLAADSLQQHVLDLSGECGFMLLDGSASSVQDSGDEQRVLALLQAMLPPGSPAAVAATTGLPLEELLEHFERQKDEVHALLRLQPDIVSGDDSMDEDAALALLFGEADTAARQRAGESPLRRRRQEVEQLRQEVEELSARNRWQQEETHQLNVESQAVARSTRDEINDSELALSEVRREVDLLSRQQAEWQRTQLRTLRLIEDLQRERTKGAHAQAVVASRLAELHRDARPSKGGSPSAPPTRRRLWEHWLPPGEAGPTSADAGSHPDNPQRLEAVRAESESLRHQIKKLEEEKLDLIHNQQSLIAFVQAKMPQLEGAAARGRRSLSGDARAGMGASPSKDMFQGP